ncbi:Rib/alpha-like domain-containing protein, partial [Corynebacterium sp. TA-R-1]
MSVALVLPFGQPIAQAAPTETLAAQGNNRALPYNLDPNCQAPSAGTGYSYGPNADLANAVKADAIANGYVRNGVDTTNAKNTISGHVFIGGYGTITNNQSASKLAVPEGTKVYMQWRSATGVLSPIYVTETHTIPGDAFGAGYSGSYAFDLREGFYDNQGNHHVFGAYNDQFYRVWVEPTVNERSGNIMYPVRAGDGIRPYFRTAFGGTRNTGQFQLIGVNQQRVDRWVAELPIDLATNRNYMKSANVVEMNFVGEGPGANTGKNRVAGRVWMEGGQGADASNGMTGPSYQPSKFGQDAPAAGYKVYLTTLTQEGVKGLADISRVDVELRSAETKKRLLAHPEWLEKTYVGTTDKDGLYSIDGIESAGRSFADVTRDVYMWVEDPNGVIMQAASGFVHAEFGNAVGANNWSPTVVPSRLVGAVINENFAIQSTPYESNIQLFVRGFDELDFPAEPGNTAELIIDGTVPLQETRIVWTKTDKQGNTIVVDPSGAPVKSGGKNVTVPTDAPGTPVLKCGDEAKANLTVPAGAEDGDLYTAYLIVGSDVRASDSFIVSSGNASKFKPEYEGVVSAEATESAAPVFYTEKNGVKGERVNNSEVPVKEYTLAPSAPEGASVDPKTGVVTLPNSARGGDKNVVVPVLVVYEGNTRDLALVEFAPVPNESDRFEPVYDQVQVDSKTSFEVPAPKWQDTKQQPTENPGAKFSIDSKTLPTYEGGGREKPAFSDVKVDPETGKITIKSAEHWGDYQIPVTVTYPDKSSEVIYVPVHVNSQADAFTPVAENPVLEKNAAVPDASGVITNKTDLPDGTEYNWVTPPSTEAPGTFENAIRVTYPDGSTEDVPVTIKVTGMADQHEPVGKDITVNQNGEVPNPETAIENPGDLPEGTKFHWLEKPKVETVGEYPVTVIVDYPDGTHDEVTVTLQVTPASPVVKPGTEVEQVPAGGEPKKLDDTVMNPTEGMTGVVR